MHHCVIRCCLCTEVNRQPVYVSMLVHVSVYNRGFSFQAKFAVQCEGMIAINFYTVMVVTT